MRAQGWIACFCVRPSAARIRRRQASAAFSQSASDDDGGGVGGSGTGKKGGGGGHLLIHARGHASRSPANNRPRMVQRSSTQRPRLRSDAHLTERRYRPSGRVRVCCHPPAVSSRRSIEALSGCIDTHFGRSSSVSHTQRCACLPAVSLFPSHAPSNFPAEGRAAQHTAG